MGYCSKLKGKPLFCITPRGAVKKQIIPHIRTVRRVLTPCLCLFFACGTAFAYAADPVHYKVSFVPTGDEELDSLLEQTSSLVALQSKLPPAPFALIGRANADEKQLITVLHSLGYDSGKIQITINNMQLDNQALLAWLNQLPETQDAQIEIKSDKGPLYTLSDVNITGLPLDFTYSPAIRTGDVARAAPILEAKDKLEQALQNQGYAFATVAEPYALANTTTHKLHVSFAVNSGPHVDIGSITFSGLKRTDASFLQRNIGLYPGQPYAARNLQTARNTLLDLGIFSSVMPVLAQHETNGRVPVDFHMAEMKRHTISLSAAYATDTGISLGTSWKDRNLFGRAESLTLSAAVSGIAGNSTDGLGYDVKGVFSKPDYYVHNQTLTLSAEALKESLTAYNRKGMILGGSLSRPITSNTSISYGPTFINELVKQEGKNETYILAQFPIGFNWNTANSLFEPTNGHKLSLSLTPTYPVIGKHSSLFVILLANGSIYIPVQENAWSVIAIHGIIGSIQGTTQFKVPPDQRFYAGGSGTIRGYSYQTVGPLFADDKPEGGLALDAVNFEFRQHITKTIGIVPFVDAGQASAGSSPFKGKVRVGYGLGLRYYTGIGPIRLDLAFPVKRTAGSGAFAIYIGLGEAF